MIWYEIYFLSFFFSLFSFFFFSFPSFLQAEHAIKKIYLMKGKNFNFDKILWYRHAVLIESYCQISSNTPQRLSSIYFIFPNIILLFHFSSFWVIIIGQLPNLCWKWRQIFYYVTFASMLLGSTKDQKSKIINSMQFCQFKNQINK